MKKNLNILLLVGPPGSGKSTFAKYFLRTEENWMRVSRDDFRMMNFAQGNLSDKQESLITEMVDASISALLNKNINVLIDATHCKKEYIDSYIKKYNSRADISFKLFDIEKNELLKRCETRYKETGKYIPEKVLNKMYSQFEILKNEFDFSIRSKIENLPVEIRQQKADLPKAIICDLDGTLALIHGRNPFDASKCNDDHLNEPIGNLLKNYAQLGYKILLVSGREDRFKEPTLEFLNKYKIPFNKLWMRKTLDKRKDAIVKEEIFETHINNNYYIEFVLDDRNQVVDMWRKNLKITCFQVNYGDF